MMGEHGQWWKRSFYEASARVPLLFHAPGRIASGHAVRQNVSLVDIFPTLCDLAGLPVPDGLDGRSMAKLLRGEADPDWRDIAFCENWQPWPSYEHFPAYMLKKGSLKLQQFGASRRKVLFDLEKDPGELTNVADDPAYAEARVDLEAELAGILEPAGRRARV
jgi:choline-sulfatase